MAEPDIEVREAATPEDRAAVFQLRREIFVEEQHLVFGPEVGAMHDPLDESAVLVLATQGDEVLGAGRLIWGGAQEFTERHQLVHDVGRFLSVVPAAEIAIVDRLAVRPAARGGPVPARIIRALLDRGLDWGATVLLADAQPHLVLSYERLGLRPYLPPLTNVAGVTIPLAGIGQDVDYLRSIGSPVADYVAGRIATPEPGRIDALRALFPARPPVRSEITNPDSYRADTTAALEGLAPLGLGSPITDVAALLDSSLVIDCPPELPLILSGMVQQTLFLILEGLVDVFEVDRHIGTSGAGSFTGEVAFLLAQPRMSEVRSGPDGAALLGFSRSSLREAFETAPAACAALYRAVATDLARKLLERQADTAARV